MSVIYWCTVGVKQTGQDIVALHGKRRGSGAVKCPNNVPSIVLSFHRLFGIIRHHGNNVNPFHQKSTTSIIWIFVWFCSTNLSFIDIMQPMFWTVISASTSIHFCLLIASLGAESHRKWPRTFFCILVIYLSMSFIHQSLQILFKLVTTRQFMESDALIKFLGGNGLVNEFDIYLFMNWNILKWIISWTPGGGTPL